ncbi:MAG: type II toxin-antitoxin system RelE/ParE family toxin [Nitrospinae bacterium]|nr:type II toxin-antitoxin system RelE/ParE family toxin [Nitrospinota bacterium]
MTWRIEWDDRAVKELRKLPPAARRDIFRYFAARVEGKANPRAQGKPLKGELAGFWRYRVGDYRVLCRLEDDVLVVFVAAIGHRKDIYRS